MAGRKGNGGEREVAALMGTWWSAVEPDAKFVRTPSSGGWLGQGGAQVRGELHATGDLMTTAKRFPFDVEVKRQERWHPDQLVKITGPVWEWWVQCQRGAKDSKRVAMLWFRRNRGEWHVFLPFDYGARFVIAGAPLHIWSRNDLLRVDFGEHVPICYLGSVILKQNPHDFAL